MEEQPLTVRVGGSELIAVPAIHFNHVFAREVYRLCDEPATRPDAVAVELGPIRTEAVRSWMNQLGVGAPSGREFPVMLGLLRRNRLIRASLRGKAIELQQRTGKDLSELSPEVLRRELGHSGHGLVLLSPTDSIIEAVRCALELDIPVSGVDLDELPGCDHRSAPIQDPLQAVANLPRYVARNAPWTVHGSDEEIDRRREFAMAARLKGMLRRYSRVLFTGGIGHWVRIQELLADASVRPAAIPVVHAAERQVFQRVIAHPLIAVEHMDLFPALAKEYLRLRTPLGRSHRPSAAPLESLDPLSLFEEELGKAYRSYFLGQNGGQGGRRKSRELELIRAYENYLSNLCLLSRMEVPNLFHAVGAAMEMMGRDFSRALTESFMEFPWARPEDYPECSILGPDRHARSGSKRGVVLDRDKGQETPVFWDSAPSAVQPGEQNLPYEWKALEEQLLLLSFSGTQYTWLPTDRLATAMSTRAMELSTSESRVERVHEFSGSFRGGIHIRSTLRSFAKGQERIYVRDSIKKKVPRRGSADGFPVVWLIDLEDAAACDWQVLHVHFSDMESYVRDRPHFDSVRSSFGSYMVAVIAYAKRNVNKAEEMKKAGISVDQHKGVIIYQPLAWTNEQFARWLEHTGYRRNLVCRRSNRGSDELELRHFLTTNHGIDMKEHHWSTILVMLAIPFARNVLPVVIPRGYQIERAAYEMAAKYGVGLSPISIANFAPGDVEKLNTCYLVPVITNDPQCVYSEEIEEAIGEKQTSNWEMVPKEILEFGRTGL